MECGNQRGATAPIYTNKTATLVPEFSVEDLLLGRTETLLPAFAVKDLPLGKTLMMMMMKSMYSTLLKAVSRERTKFHIGSWDTNLMQRLSNYSPRTTCGPTDLSLWSFKKFIRKIKIQVNCVSHYIWNSQSLEMTHGNRLSLFLPVLIFYE